MRTSLSIAFCIGLASCSEHFLTRPESFSSASDGFSCLIYDSLTVFNLKALQDLNGYSQNGFRFSFCKRFNITNTQTGKSIETYAFKESAESTVETPRGIPYTKGSYPITTQAVDADAVPGEPRHLNVTYDSPTICNDGWVTDRFWKTNIEIFCDPEGKLSEELLSSEFKVVEDSKACILKISARHKAGCPIVEASSIVAWLAKNPGVAGIILLSFGFVCTFFGARVFHAIITVAGGLIVFFMMLMVLSVLGGLRALDSEVASKNFGWILVGVICFILAAFAGIGIGFLTHKYKRFGSALFGLVIGLLIGYYVH